jgi:broad specificity phosphatase PhoE
MNIFICRHAQVHNLNKVVYRRLPGYHLSKEGETQARQMGDFLKKYRIEEIFTSPLERCVQVSDIIKETINDSEIKIYQKDYLNEWDDGERTEDIAKRMRLIMKDYRNNRVYVSHKDPIRVFLNDITEQPLRELDRWACPHGSIYRIMIGDKISVKLIFVPEDRD